ncbi:MAG: ATP-binding protein [Oscillospiraceae bacterium]|nr:ATP-binding protein [Oscillospiraceae bacterium]
MGGTERKKKLPVGIEDFAKLRTEGFYYIDKTGMIRDLLNAWGEVNLFTRPRRFGKSLNMSMLKSFFEIGCDRTLFNGLDISGETELCEKYMGKFPVISISLKNVDGLDYAQARAALCSVIGNEALRFQFLLQDDKLTEKEKSQYQQLTAVDTGSTESFLMPDSVLMGSLKTLSALLQKHYGKKVIILIDEYDVPLAKANERGYYAQMVNLIRNLFNQALKTNESLYFAVLTGCLRVAKESIFTGLNNPNILSITTVRFDEYFGFTDEEVKGMLEYYHLMEHYGTIREWYDGYRFGNVDVYCPWDVISYCYELMDDPSALPRDYWSNTSGNDVVRHFIETVDNGLTRGEIEALAAGETVVKEIHEDLTYNRLYDSIDHLWSVLFTTGYLTQRGRPDGKKYQLAIPNREIRNIFTEQIMCLFKENVAQDGALLNAFCAALQSGDAPEVEKHLAAYLGKTVSIRDTFVQRPIKENFYHGILLGILGYKSGWYVKSNREAGDGYSDIYVIVEDENIGIIIEVKYAEQGRLSPVCEKALAQIEAGRYAEELKAEGCREIYKYGIACYKRKCKVICEKELLPETD